MPVSKLSLKKNIIYNLIYTTINLLFPVMVFPYVSRILGPEGVGAVSYSEGFVAYFTLIANLGIPIYGVREVAKLREDKKKLSQFTYEMFIILGISVLITYSTLFFIVFKFGEQISNRDLIILFSSTLVLATIGVEWFYKGIENFKYITLRNILFKVLGLVLMYLLIKEENDYLFYGVVIIISTFGGNFLNIINLSKYINFKRLDFPNLRQHVKPIMLSFVFVAITSIYSNLDTVMLGVMGSNKEVGLYTSANKIVKLVLTIITTVSVALLPRISFYVSQKEDKKIREILKNALNYLFFISIPAIIGISMLASEIIIVFSGEEFIGASESMRILAPIILLIGLSNLLGVQLLYPLGKEKVVLLSVGVGASVNLILNIVLIKTYGSNGASIATLFAEGIVTIVQLIYIYNKLGYKIFDKCIFKYVLASIVMGSVVKGVTLLDINSFMTVLLSVSFGVITYCLVLILLRDTFLLRIVKELLYKLKGERYE